VITARHARRVVAGEAVLRDGGARHGDTAARLDVAATHPALGGPM
jgi:hypothetical protein